GRAGVVRPVAPLVDVARARRRPADVGRLLHVGGTGGVGAGARLRRVADARGGATLGPRGLEAVGRAGVVRPVAPLVDVARAGRRPADVGRLLHVRGAGGGGAGARLRRIAHAGGGGTRDVGARAGLRRVTHAGGRPADRAGGLEAVRGAGVVRAVAALLGVARTGRRAADVGLLHVGRARAAGTGADLRRVADAGRGATHGAAGREAIDGARVVR